MSDWVLPSHDSYFAKELAKDKRGFQISHLEAGLKFCQKFRLAVDGGAHIGTWSVALAKRFTSVVAFEPAADTYFCLRRNLQNHGVANVRAYQLALGDQPRIGRMQDDETRSGNTGARYFVEGIGDVKTTTIDYYGLVDVDFIKLDVEGFELAALYGARETLARCSPVVMIEVKQLRAGHNPFKAHQWLQDFGYAEVGKVGKDCIFVKR